jgi:hypothetical protein
LMLRMSLSPSRMETACLRCSATASPFEELLLESVVQSYALSVASEWH